MRSTSSTTAASAALFADACAVIPGGVNSPVRAFNSVGGTPRFITSAERLLAHRRRRQRICRPGVFVGADDPRARSPRRRRRRPARRGRWAVVRRPDPIGDRTRRRDHRQGGSGRPNPPGELRHRGHHERHQTCPRIYRPGQDRQVLRLLPRAQRCAAGRRGLRCRDAGPAVVARCHRGRRGRHDRAALQQHRGDRGDLRPVRRRDRLRHHRGQPRQHGHRATAAGLQRRAATHHRPSTVRC